MNGARSGGVCVRWVDLDSDGERLHAINEADAVLSPGEVRRSAGIPDAGFRRSWLASRIALRLALMQESSIDCRGREFLVSSNGKPHLPGHPVHFSLSRSKRLVVVAVSGRPVGIDVERSRLLPPDIRTAARKAIGRIAVRTDGPDGGASEQAIADMRIWTLLEAMVKLRDGRLAESLAVWSAGRAAPDPARGGGDRADAGRTVTALAVPVLRGYVCSCCVFGKTAGINAAPLWAA